MLLTKILASFQILHYYRCSAQPVSPSGKLLKRAENIGACNHVSQLIHPTPRAPHHEGEGKLILESEKLDGSENIKNVDSDGANHLGASASEVQDDRTSPAPNYAKF
ncbi:uncharacterized protein PGTG_15454 [Puccinia graminis f. sp. tritici CRL 75-36-700-3]|uniref:Uncharacterized protein n=1 Tax=Puccinia graminis f. sp. tritici (strain CRL 75-36-700-3 / race SCCL) TaxID=418459 RepID=E3KYJ8_PUCGT|nr:uncharacterized protein PGTG_15454 [Puccinia graminis f. sp. tritici CRL 75-36-700-3]EFP89275.1 hypothetical protein PGTG_15454 [Puccinia graminis f. sp. tritici CRL 75-36-700-3]